MRDSFNVFVEHTPADPSICLYKSESRDQKRSEVNRGRSPVGGFKGSVKDLRKQTSPSIRSQSDVVLTVATAVALIPAVHHAKSSTR